MTSAFQRQLEQNVAIQNPAFAVQKWKEAKAGLGDRATLNKSINSEGTNFSLEPKEINNEEKIFPNGQVLFSSRRHVSMQVKFHKGKQKFKSSFEVYHDELNQNLKEPPSLHIKFCLNTKEITLEEEEQMGSERKSYKFHCTGTLYWQPAVNLDNIVLVRKNLIFEISVFTIEIFSSHLFS